MGSAWVDIAAGWAAGAATGFLMQPLDTCLTRMQAGPRLLASKAPLGLRGLWRGSVPMLVVIPAQNALMFAGYGAGERAARRAKRKSDKEDNSTAAAPAAPLWPVFAGGCLGGIATCLVSTPAELLKVQRQIGGTIKETLRLALSSSGGIKVLFRGLSATLLRDGIPHGVWFVSYEWAKRRMTGARSRKKQALASAGNKKLTRRGKRMSGERATKPKETTLTAGETLLCGAFAALIAWIVSYPFDPIKTRIQAAALAKGKQDTFQQTARLMLEEANGNFVEAYYKGFGLKMANRLPSSAINFFVYEVLRKTMEESGIVVNK